MLKYETMSERREGRSLKGLRERVATSALPQMEQFITVDGKPEFHGLIVSSRSDRGKLKPLSYHAKNHGATW